MNHEIKLYSRRTGVAFVLMYAVLLVVFVLLGLPLLAAALSPPGGEDFLLMRLTIFVAVLLYGFLMTSLLMHMVHALRFAGRPVLIFNGLGVIDNTNPLAVGLIRWDEIEEIFRCEFYSSGATPTLKKEKGIAIRVRNWEHFLSRYSPLTRAIFRWKSGSGLLVISAANLGLNNVELTDLIDKIGKTFHVRVRSAL